MKRALAERAKQSGHLNGLGPAASVVTQPQSQQPIPSNSNLNSTAKPLIKRDQQKPRKMPKIEKPQRTKSPVPAPKIKTSTATATTLPLSSTPVRVPSSSQSQPRSKIKSEPQEQLASSIPKLKLPKVPSTSSTAAAAVAAVPVRVKLEPNLSIKQGSSATATNSASTNPRPLNKKRQRPSSSSLSSSKNNNNNNSEEESDHNAFYLKHQNRALASELKAMKYSLHHLESEREIRRTHCQQALEQIIDLEATWTRMEVALQLSGTAPPGTIPTADANSTTTASLAATPSIKPTPPSTGKGDSVELIGALLDSLATLAKKTKSESKTIDDDTTADDVNAHADADADANAVSLSRSVQTVSERAAVLQQWIWKVLGIPTSLVKEKGDALGVDTTIANAAQVSSLTMQCQTYETQIAELAKARDEATNSDRRVRRSLYRLASKRMNLEEVLKAVEESAKDGVDTMDAFMAIEGSLGSAHSGNNHAQTKMMLHSHAEINTTGALTQGETVGGPNDNDDQPAMDGSQITALKKKMQDLEEISASRETQIDELVKERELHMKRINSLVLTKSKNAENGTSIITNDAIQCSSLYNDTATKLTTAERQVQEMQDKMKHIKLQWARSKGDAELARKTLEDLQNKHKKRWAELTSNPSDGVSSSNGPNAAETGNHANSEYIAHAKRIIELEHKLRQALENVRQADTVRVSLGEAIKMNESHQAKLEELKIKNAALVATKSAARASLDSSGQLSSSSSNKPSMSSAASSSSGSGDREKLRRTRKELAAATVSKEGAKAKQDRAEKERDALIKTNVRLLKQSAEKDDMNAKSLSTILHLKHVTKQLEQEKEILEQKKKSSTQLALAARLATNAKERVHEEAMKETKLLEEKICTVEQQCECLRQTKEISDGKLTQLKAEMSTYEKDVRSSTQRCEELVEESTKVNDDKRRLLESLAVAQREANESASKCANMKSRSGGGGSSCTSEFTAEQLSTQVTVLKSRLVCPVCNSRDKKCILLRCRHMFCKECVEINVKNRSRKCPACGQRFDNKDVADVWL